MSAIIVDKAEHAEALKANIVWSYGLDNVTHLLSSFQLANFKKNIPLQQEEDVKGEKGAYFISTKIVLKENSFKSLFFVANVNQSQSNIIALSVQIKAYATLAHKISENIEAGTQHLQQLTAAADSL